MAYAVKRTNPSGSDFLHAWCDTWGTSCMGAQSLALQFKTEQEAHLAAAKARRVCRGFNGRPAQHVAFAVVQI